MTDFTFWGVIFTLAVFVGAVVDGDYGSAASTAVVLGLFIELAYDELKMRWMAGKLLQAEATVKELTQSLESSQTLLSEAQTILKKIADAAQTTRR